MSNGRAATVTPLLKMPRIGTFHRDTERKKKESKKSGQGLLAGVFLRFHIVEVFICPARAHCKLAANLKQLRHVGLTALAF